MSGMAFEFPEAVKKRRKPAPSPEPASVKPATTPILNALGLAYRIEAKVAGGGVGGHAEAARTLGVSRARVAQLTKLLFLSPRIQEAILDAPRDRLAKITERRLRPIVDLPDWQQQAALWAKL